MQTSLFLAKLIGPVMLVLGAALLINARDFRAVIDDYIGKWDPLESTCRHASLSIL